MPPVPSIASKIPRKDVKNHTIGNADKDVEQVLLIAGKVRTASNSSTFIVWLGFDGKGGVKLTVTVDSMVSKLERQKEIS